MIAFVRSLLPAKCRLCREWRRADHMEGHMFWDHFGELS